MRCHRLSCMILTAVLVAFSPLTGAAAERVATFGGGCFWCMEPPYDRLAGVSATVSGYMGGDTADPTYQEVSAGGTGHVEVVQVTYDPERIDYRKLLEVYWRNVDPVDGGGQFCDRGSQYRPVIFTHSRRQQRLAEASKQALADSGRFAGSIAVTVEPAETFYRAEAYHQNYYRENPISYKFYRYSCGRDDRLEAVWGDEAGGRNIGPLKESAGAG